ncbi:MAG: Uma2 family endonuclease [Gemmatimonadaceae bacterium]
MSHTAERLYTIDELPDLPECYELVDGELIMMMSPAGSLHGYLVVKISAMLNAYVEEKTLGMVFGEQTGFILARHPDTVRAPDAAFVCNTRLSSIELGDGYFPGYPDLAVEILSPSNRPSAMRRKIDQYFAAGTRLVWVVNPRERSIVVHSLLHPPTTLHEADTLDGEDVLPGFHYEMAHLFARLKRS